PLARMLRFAGAAGAIVAGWLACAPPRRWATVRLLEVCPRSAKQADFFPQGLLPTDTFHPL
ncbi:hypothetical protein, partial [Nonomuraea sp. NPDC046570]|uniref:hypothetical protein n=1 Tax=Nonomuraea sp. NPDC046570 TaxID=3155255 RepID=UPI0033C7B0CC